MKLMTYNILNGGQERLPHIIEAIGHVSPDYLAINEANAFAVNENRVLKDVAKQIGLPYFDIALSGEYDYHVAVFSRYPLQNIHKLRPLMRACIVATIKTEIGDLSIASFHLTPYSEDLRQPEIDLILGYQKQFENRILMGDMNSLSQADGYDPNMVKSFNEMQRKKYTSNGRLRFDVISRITTNGYYDTAAQLNKNTFATAPTSINEYEAHTNMRLDYIFVSKPLLSCLKDYEAINNDLTSKASDHYPVVVHIENNKNSK